MLPSKKQIETMFFVYSEPINQSLSRLDQQQGAECPPSRTGAAAAQTAGAPPTVTEHLAEVAEVGERLPSRAGLAGVPSAAAVAPPTAIEPMTTMRAGQLLNDNQNVFAFDTSFLQNLIFKLIHDEKLNGSLFTSIFKCL